MQGMRSIFLPLMLRLLNGLNNDLKVEDEVIKSSFNGGPLQKPLDVEKEEV